LHMLVLDGVAINDPVAEMEVNWLSIRPSVALKTERLKVLKVIGEQVAQVVEESEVPIKAIKVERIDAKLGPVTEHVFANKVVLQGVILKQIIFVDPGNFLRHTAEEVPFMTGVTIPGLKPGDDVEIQTHVLDLDTDFHLEPSCDSSKSGRLRQKIVAHILVKAAQWRQIDVVTDVRLSPRCNTMSRVFCK